MSDVYDKAGAGSVRHGVCIYGSIYGQRGSRVRTRERNTGADEKSSRKRQGYMDDTIALIKRSHSGDKKARDQLVEENVGLVHCVVKRFL